MPIATLVYFVQVLGMSVFVVVRLKINTNGLEVGLPYCIFKELAQVYVPELLDHIEVPRQYIAVKVTKLVELFEIIAYIVIGKIELLLPAYRSPPPIRPILCPI